MRELGYGAILNNQVDLAMRVGPPVKVHFFI
jgi:hypothetical protein